MPKEIVVADIYRELEAPARKIAQDAVPHIAKLHRRVVTDSAEIGATLLRVKEAIGHGNFGPWLKAEFNWTERTAQNLMSVAERFGSNTKHVSHLPLSTVYRLAAPSTPDAVREKIVHRLAEGEAVAPDEIADEISTARREAERDRREAKLPAKRRARLKADRERQAREFALEQERREAQRALHDEATREAAALIVSKLAPADLDRLLALMAVKQGAHPASPTMRLMREDLEKARAMIT